MTPKKTEEKRKIPIAWSPPESLRKRLFSEKSDVWSYGILLWEIATFGIMPWKGSNAREIITFLEQGVRLDRPLATSEKLWSLMLSCWNGDPVKRPTFDKIVEISLELAPPEVSVVKVKLKT